MLEIRSRRNFSLIWWINSLGADLFACRRKILGQNIRLAHLADQIGEVVLVRIDVIDGHNIFDPLGEPPEDIQVLGKVKRLISSDFPRSFRWVSSLMGGDTVQLHGPEEIMDDPR